MTCRLGRGQQGVQATAGAQVECNATGPPDRHLRQRPGVVAARSNLHNRITPAPPLIGGVMGEQQTLIGKYLD
jgi:hypothetical protein